MQTSSQACKPTTQTPTSFPSGVCRPHTSEHAHACRLSGGDELPETLLCSALLTPSDPCSTTQHEHHAALAHPCAHRFALGWVGHTVTEAQLRRLPPNELYTVGPLLRMPLHSGT